MKLAKKVAKNKSEFNGRFFVKIKRDSFIDTYIRSVGNPTPSINVTQSIQQYALNPDKSDSDSNFWEDVGETWFIDAASREQAGTFGGGGSGPYHHDDGFGIHGNDPINGRTNNTNFTYVTNNSTVNSPVASYNATGKSWLQSTMELTLNNINDFMDWDLGKNTQANQTFHDTMSTVGTKFRWKEDPYQHIYRISFVRTSADGETNGRGIYNFSSHQSWKHRSENKSIRLYIRFKTTGWRLNADQSDANAEYEFFQDEADLFPFQDSSFVPSIHNGDIINNTIQVIDFDTGDVEPVFTANPAIWETEPKEDKGLDIYYEASQAYPVSLTQKTNELLLHMDLL